MSIRPATRCAGFVLAALLFTAPVFAQTGLLAGTVTDAEGDPLVGANIRVEQTTLGAATDLDGTFRITSIPAGDQSVVITLVGYQRVERDVSIPPGGEARLDVSLETDALNSTKSP